MLNKERLVGTFLDLVRIDSPSGEEKAITEYVASRFREIGLEPKIDPIYNLSVQFPGTGRPFFLNAHTDRVEPGRGVNPVIEDDLIKSDGRTVLGADDLAGVAAILEATQSLFEDGAPHLPLEIAITSQEEVGLIGAKGLDLSQFRAREGVVLDAHGPVGEITIAAPTMNVISATIFGRAAHSGVEPEKGIDAVRVAANAIAKMKLGRIDKETTANIGIIKGGSGGNIVPERVELTGEARSRNQRKLERQTKAMKQALERAARPFSARVELQVERAFNRYKFRKGHSAVKRVAKAISKIGRKPRYVVTGGGSDANIFNAKRMKTVVASIGYEQIHTTSEYIPIVELVKVAELVLALSTE